jgi:[acyl-carrier-protein] S-malonyltransferase
MTTAPFSIVFPGQGSQSIGMLSELSKQYDVVQETFSEASEALGYDLWKLIQEGPEEVLNLTEKTQPAMLSAGVSIWRAWLSEGGLTPAMMAGHSLGEYTALVCAGSLKFSEAVTLVAERGRYMQEACPEGTGGMAAILGLDDNKVREVCSQAAESQIVEAVNYNSPGQVVIAGDKAAVERACTLAKEAGAKRALPLPVSVPSHCTLMEPAAQRLRERLNQIEINDPTLTVLHNIDVTQAGDAENIRERLAGQLYRPVRWVETIQAMVTAGMGTVIEAGPGKVLTGLCKRIDRNLKGVAVFDSESLKNALEAMK